MDINYNHNLQNEIGIHGVQPSPKAPVIDLMLSELTGKSREIQIASDLCMTCNGNADTFKDELSIKEYSISGMCQQCQDSIFGA